MAHIAVRRASCHAAGCRRGAGGLGREGLVSRGSGRHNVSSSSGRERRWMNAATFKSEVGVQAVKASTPTKAAEAGTKEAVKAPVRKRVGTAEKTRNIVFVTSECSPWSKTGGLADVCGSLPKALAARGHRVMVITPRYGLYEDAVDTNVKIGIDLFKGNAEVGYFHCSKDRVDYVFVDHPSFQRPTLYGDEQGTYGDNQFRFTLLSRAALEAPLQLPLSGSLYGDDCVFIANDWHAGMVPVYLAAKYRPNGVYTDSRSLLVIHNMFHQGVFPPGTFQSLHLQDNWFGALDYQYPEWARQGAYEEEGHSVNYLKGAICTSDRILTVSPGYAWELTTPEGGWGLDGLLKNRSYHLGGILNGLDEEDWNPALDAHIAANYDVGRKHGGRLGLKGKATCKEALQKELGLPVRPDVPMIGFIGRLDYQKGADLILRFSPWLMSQDVQFVMLGTGEKWLENGFRSLEQYHKEKARGWIGFNVAMSHKITAGCDILLMPSRFEPCGLNQLYAMRYGTVPVAHSTGGLKDTVITYNPWEKETGTGWTFSPCDEESARASLGTALDTYRHHREAFQELQIRGMLQDMSWDSAAQEYEKNIEWAKIDPPYAQ